MTTLNAHGQPIGDALPDWTPPPRPTRDAMLGRFCRLEAFEPDAHAAGLFAVLAPDESGWTYLPSGPFETEADYLGWARSASQSTDPLFFAVVLPDGRAVGVVSYLRIKPEAGSIEVGHIHFSPTLRRTPAATEAMFLMMCRAFELGYRRYEWKCDALNAPSRSAAQRLGLSFEGVFCQAIVYKGRNRDTAWYAATDKDWPELKAAFEEWLAVENFDEDGSQRTALRALTAPILASEG